MRKYGGRSSEKHIDDIYHIVLGVQHGQGTPLVEGKTRMRNVETDHIAHAKIVLRS